MNYLDLETMTSRQVSWDQLIEMCAIELADRNLTKCLACVRVCVNRTCTGAGPKGAVVKIWLFSSMIDIMQRFLD